VAEFANSKALRSHIDRFFTAELLVCCSAASYLYLFLSEIYNTDSKLFFGWKGLAAMIIIIKEYFVHAAVEK